MEVLPVVPQTYPAPVKSFYHQAATFCLAAPFVTLLVNVMAVPAITKSLPADSQARFLIPAIVLGLLVGSGIILGIISLFGIKKYGAKGILWQSLIGIFIPIALLTLAIPTFNRIKERAENLRLKAQERQHQN